MSEPSKSVVQSLPNTLSSLIVGILWGITDPLVPASSVFHQLPNLFDTEVVALGFTGELEGVGAFFTDHLVDRQRSVADQEKGLGLFVFPSLSRTTWLGHP